MLYTILCYHDEDVVFSWSKAEDDAVMARLGAIQERMIRAGKMGPSLRLLPTTSATTLRKTQDPPLIIDGPFAETKEQLLGFYVIDVADLEEALAICRELAEANPGGTYEIRPVALYNPEQRTPSASVADKRTSVADKQTSVADKRTAVADKQT